jgi:hypothetical protein
MNPGTSVPQTVIVGGKTTEVTMKQKRILRTDRIRQPGGRFSFIPHRFLLDGFLQSLNQNELSLYFFLTLASDKNGMSYYGQKSICSQIHQKKKEYTSALNCLSRKDLVAFDGVFFQVLELPERPVVLHAVNQDMLGSFCHSIGHGGQNG